MPIFALLKSWKLVLILGVVIGSFGMGFYTKTQFAKAAERDIYAEAIRRVSIIEKRRVIVAQRLIVAEGEVEIKFVEIEKRVEIPVLSQCLLDDATRGLLVDGRSR